MYCKGEGVTQDYKEAAKWYRKAAEQGNRWAQYSLGYLYDTGRGVLQDEIRAYALYSLSAAGGDERALKNRNSIAKELSPQQIAQGRKFAARLQRIIDSPPEKSATSDEASTEADKEQIKGSGTGFLITNNGYIVTCYHVIKGAGAVKVLIDDKEYEAHLVREDKHNDLALLKISGKFPALSFSSSRSAKMGQDVFTIGYPNPALQGVGKKLTDGSVSSLTGYQDDIRLYQISVPVQPGNSGGALLDKNGNVVGIIVAILKSETAFKVSGSLPQNVNYALKSTYAQTLIDTVPEASENMQPPNNSQSFDAVVERVKKSVVMIISYK